MMYTYKQINIHAHMLILQLLLFQISALGYTPSMTLTDSRRETKVEAPLFLLSLIGTNIILIISKQSPTSKQVLLPLVTLSWYTQY